MKFKNTLILFLVGCALAAYVVFVEPHFKTTEESRDIAEHVVEVEKDKITGISIKNQESTIELKKRDGQWYIEQPVKDRADGQTVTHLFETVEDLHHAASFSGDNKDQLKEFGLSDPSAKITFTGEKEKPIELDLGKDTAVDGKVYAIVAGGNKVEVIGNELKAQLNKKPDDFRDKNLAGLTTQQVSKVEVKTSAGDLELAKTNGHWWIRKPLEARADDSKVNDLVSRASTAQVQQFIADQNLANYGLAEPQSSITFTVEGSDKPAVLQVGTSPKEDKDKEKEKGKGKEGLYVKLSTREGVMLAPKAGVQALLDSKPNDLRDHALVRFESDIVDRVTIEPQGKAKIVLARKGESWVRKDGDKDAPINVDAAKRLLADLSASQSVRFVSDAATDLPKYGLDKPQLSLTLSSFASENTAETNAGEKPIVTIQFGGPDGPNNFAKLDNEPFIVSVSRSLVESIYTDPIQWQDLTVYKFSPEDITSVEVTKAGIPPVAFERDKDKGWKMTAGEGALIPANVTELVRSLADLRASRWEGPVSELDGLDKPRLIVTFKAGAADKAATEKVSLGVPNGENQIPAAAEGHPGAFILTNADVSALTAPLTDKEAESEAAAKKAAAAKASAAKESATSAAPGLPIALPPVKEQEPAAPAAPTAPAAPAAPAVPTAPTAPMPEASKGAEAAPLPTQPAAPAEAAPATPNPTAPAAPTGAPASTQPATAPAETAPAKPSPAVPAPAPSPAAPSENSASTPTPAAEPPAASAPLPPANSPAAPAEPAPAAPAAPSNQ